jgi:L-fuconolactonase
MPIIDTHTHFYDPRRPQGVPWPPADNKALYRPVLPEHFKAVAEPLGVTGTVVVEASEWLEDNQWLLDLAADEPAIVGVVGHLDPASPEFAAHLDRFAADPLFRGIRPRGRDCLGDHLPRALPGFRALSDADLSLDLLVATPELPGAAELASELPDVRIVINHVAMVPITGRPPDPAWVEGMRQVAAASGNTWCKVSGLVEVTAARPAPTGLDYYRPTLDVLWHLFGPARLIYASNWPVSEPHAPYAAQLALVQAYFTEKDPTASERFFHQNAQAAYKYRDDAS